MRKRRGRRLGEIVYVRPEDEHLHRESDWSFTFQAGNKAESSLGLVQHRLVMGIKKEGVRRARAELDKVRGFCRPRSTRPAHLLTRTHLSSPRE